MISPQYDRIAIGEVLPPLRLAPVSRTTLALFAGASGDHNPVHIDIDAARAAGMDDVFAQGMLGMAWLGRVLLGWVPQEHLRQWSVRFLDITRVGDVITCTGRVLEKYEEAGERRVRLEVTAANQNGTVTIAGHAVIAFSQREDTT